MWRAFRMPRRHHAMQGEFERARGVGEEVGDAAQRLVGGRIEHVQDGADQECVGGFFPMVAALEGALRVDQDVRDVLHVAHLVRAAADFEQGVVRGRPCICGVEQEAVREARAPPCRQMPVLALDVVDDSGGWPSEKSWDHEPDAFARTRGSEGHDVLGTGVAQIVRLGLRKLAEEDSLAAQQASTRGLPGFRPARGSVGDDALGRASTPSRHGHGAKRGQGTPGSCDASSVQEDGRRICIEGEPPRKQAPREVDRLLAQKEPGSTKLRLVVQGACRPLSARPERGQGHETDDKDLSKKDAGGHAAVLSRCSAPRWRA
jgi:hypothetical protein